MRKYKHKLLKDVTASFVDAKVGYQIYGIKSDFSEFIAPELVESSNDWELVESSLSRAEIIKIFKKEELNYLITAFRLSGTENDKFAIGKDGKYEYWFTLDDMLNKTPSVKSGAFEIYSVKNSKGEEFTIGDRFDSKISKNCVITKFGIIKNIIVVYAERKNGFLELDWITKSKNPIFVSADGKEIYEGDRIFMVTKDFAIHNNPCNEHDGTNIDYVYFSTKELAQEYIDNNKPRFSLTDIENLSIEITNPSWIGFPDNTRLIRLEDLKKTR